MELFKSNVSRHALNTTANHTVGVKYTQGRHNQLRWDQWLVHHQVYFTVKAVGFLSREYISKCDNLIHKPKRENKKTCNFQNRWSKLSVMQWPNRCLFCLSSQRHSHPLDLGKENLTSMTLVIHKDLNCLNTQLLPYLIRYFKNWVEGASYLSLSIAAVSFEET